ncbi:GFA family protein [Paracandidimonas soli]|uniref:CENP-V/GFA domain-containing protein n=1 Tax=Paracandidimonas soli TaxID=1917182 RepID=A0A4R3V9F1_9BURK|nr:GFA family protein [Paracandidimonas soli]TCV01847.1 hypothetical protein EV686_102561 [Paracandidimonas soli]
MDKDASAQRFQGRCLCGAVTLTIRAEQPSMDVCHCNICRRWGGGPLMSIEQHDAPDIRGSEHVGIYASSDWAERGFCKQCGTHLFYRLKQGSFHAIPVGLFDEGDSWKFKQQIFIDQKPRNYQFADQTTVMTGQEVFDQWSASQG